MNLLQKLKFETELLTHFVTQLRNALFNGKKQKRPIPCLTEGLHYGV